MSSSKYSALLQTLDVDGKSIKYYNLAGLGDAYSRLPFSIRVLLESAVRNCDNFQVRLDGPDWLAAGCWLLAT